MQHALVQGSHLEGGPAQCLAQADVLRMVNSVGLQPGPACAPGVCCGTLSRTVGLGALSNLCCSYEPAQCCASAAAALEGRAWQRSVHASCGPAADQLSCAARCGCKPDPVLFRTSAAGAPKPQPTARPARGPSCSSRWQQAHVRRTFSMMRSWCTRLKTGCGFISRTNTTSPGSTLGSLPWPASPRSTILALCVCPCSMCTSNTFFSETRPCQGPGVTKDSGSAAQTARLVACPVHARLPAWSALRGGKHHFRGMRTRHAQAWKNHAHAPECLAGSSWARMLCRLCQGQTVAPLSAELGSQVRDLGGAARQLPAQHKSCRARLSQVHLAGAPRTGVRRGDAEALARAAVAGLLELLHHAWPQVPHHQPHALAPAGLHSSGCLSAGCAAGRVQADIEQCDSATGCCADARCASPSAVRCRVF